MKPNQHVRSMLTILKLEAAALEALAGAMLADPSGQMIEDWQAQLSDAACGIRASQSVLFEEIEKQGEAEEDEERLVRVNVRRVQAVDVETSHHPLGVKP